MALLPSVFIPDEVEDASFSTIPAGWYDALITKSELKSTKDNTGKYLSLTFKIIDGEYENRLVFANLNLINNSDVAVRIARSDLKKICGAVGFEGDLEDSADLHGIPMKVLVSVKPANAQWPEKNELKSYANIDFDPDDESVS